MIFEKLREELGFLLTPGRIGEFDHIELIEVIGTPRGGAPINVLSVAVLAEGRPDVGESERTQSLTGRIQQIGGFKDWSFGVMHTLRPVAALDQALATLEATGQWMLSGHPLGVGILRPEPAMFAPPDGTVRVPLNNVLKNNFWAGSHVFRLTDQDKTPFAPFFADRRRLQALSDAVSIGVPIALAGLADLLGDVLIQLPVTILVPSVTAPRGAEHSDVAVAWRNGSTQRPLTIAARTRWDELLTGAAVSERFIGGTRIPVDNDRQPLETEIWDAEAGILVAATASTSTIKQVQLGMNVIQHEPRLFTAPDIEGQPVAERVKLTETRISFIGTAASQDADFWLSRRQDLEERRRLEETRDFVQYRPQTNSSAEQARALADLRFLIDRYGQTGSDLWDPYLSAEDLLRTLFWCCHSGAPLRALTDGREPPGNNPQNCSALQGSGEPRPSFPDQQRAVLERDAGNREGLHLEYRTRRGPKGWHFHDRFLIFPNMHGGPLAWSLGTSVNSLGQAHHILQRVSNPAMVAGAFEDLWLALDEPQHVIWRSW
ncbi:VPA1262 family N-terminal domain-containing protein [Brucella pituitosa]|uniref:VPA1262 family N-terminal domain-containing protein n=1 Tax=Brucella pituitosa TaxID=571256 RepID=UPI00126017E9|nr:VPA1262 family N-terminal domain-containing protein [Brucella pituitosa]